ncbi:hypothetical protein CC80DRAFT_66473 [Byssothecium circinans]|uniref:Uncharacterized protein n=1 Tax=Byssothecium circinans TaxID=147558 RepID=A0A6A5TWJ5_9PLEO|nr:hypothetical protein CC80DRAFT_66473 [Byssothecium circinans]
MAPEAKKISRPGPPLHHITVFIMDTKDVSFEGNSLQHYIPQYEAPSTTKRLKKNDVDERLRGLAVNRSKKTQLHLNAFVRKQVRRRRLHYPLPDLVKQHCCCSIHYSTPSSSPSDDDYERSRSFMKQETHPNFDRAQLNAVNLMPIMSPASENRQPDSAYVVIRERFRIRQ